MLSARRTGILHHPFAPWIAPPDQLVRTLVGREHVLRDVLEKIQQVGKGATPKHVLLFGPRGIGKTHLLCLVHHYVSGRIAPWSGLPVISGDWKSILFVEEEHASLDRLASFLISVFKKLQEDNPGETRWQVPASVLDDTDDVVIEFCFDRLRDFFRDTKGRLLILIDNLQEVFEQFPLRDHHRLRAFLTEQKALLLIGTARTVFRSLLDYKAPFYEFFEPVRLVDLTQDKMLYMLETRFREDGLADEFQSRKENLRRKLPAIRKLTGGNPRLVIFLYQIVTRSAFLQVEDSLHQLIEELSEYFRSRYGALAVQPRKILDTIAEMEGPATPTEIAGIARLSVQSVNSQLKRLVQEFYVERVKSVAGRHTRYDVSERLFRIWRQTASAAGLRRFKLLAEFLKIYYTPEEIGQQARFYTSALLSHHHALEANYSANLQEGLYYLQEAAAGTPARYEIFRQRIDCFAGLGQYGQAEDEISHFLEDATRLKDETGVATAYGAQVKLSASTDKYDSALSAVAKLLEMKRFTEALSSLETILEKSPGLARAWGQRATAAGMIGDYERALESYTRAVLLEPANLEYWLLQAVVLRELGRHKEALNTAWKAVELEPKIALGWEEIGRAAINLGRHAEALQSFEKALELDPSNAMYWHLRATALNQLARYEEALNSARRAVELDPKMAWAWVTMGLAAMNLGNHQDALLSFQKATELEPGKAAYLLLQAMALRQLERNEEALTSSTKALELDAKIRLAWQEAGLAAGNLGRYQEALSSFQKAVELEPGNAECWRLQAVALASLHRFEEALASFNQASGLAPENADILIQKAFLLGIMDRTDEALAALRAAFCIPGWDTTKWFRRDFGLFLRRLLDKLPAAFISVIDMVKEKVTDKDTLDLLLPYFKAVEYSRTGDQTILDRLFPEVRELVLEISGKLPRH